VTVLPPVLRVALGDDVHVLGFNAPQLNLIVFGLAIVVFLTAAPGGLARFNLHRLFKPKAAIEPDRVHSPAKTKEQRDQIRNMGCA
jgi:hypothetical protein